MKLQYINNNTTFTGYDARKIKAFAMNNNYANIANELKKIGDIENFNVLMLEKDSEGLTLKKEDFIRSALPKKAWAQDIWGIAKNLYSFQH